MKLQQILQLFQERPDFLVPWAFRRPGWQVGHRKLISNPMRALVGLPPPDGHRLAFICEGVCIVASAPHYTNAVSGVLCLGEKRVYMLQKVFHLEKLKRLGFGCARDEGDQGTPGVPWRSGCWG